MGAGVVRRRYTPIIVTAGSTTKFSSNQIGGFFCTTAGTIVITTVDDRGNTVTFPTITVAVNTWYELPFYLGTNGGTITTVGAAGILGV